MSRFEFPRFFSTDSHKAIKAREFGWLNAINYMSPARSGGVGNLCSHASPGCIALCLGLHSGQAAMVVHATRTNAVRQSRRRKAAFFMRDRAAYMSEMSRHVAILYRYATKRNLPLAVRPNGSTDIAYEGIRFMVRFELARELEAITGHAVLVGVHTIFSVFPYVQFLDYTKNPNRFKRALPANYHLTFSRSEANESVCLELLARGVNVAVVFAGAIPDVWNGFQVINGDAHDLRHLDPRGGVVVGLTPKGNKAKRDRSDFVVRH
jgi:hypothetical protein